MASTAILYRALPIETRFETINPQIIGPISEEALSAKPKYAKARLCFPFGAIYAIRERDTAQLEPYQIPIIVVAITNNVKLLRNPIRGKIIIHPKSINIRVLF